MLNSFFRKISPLEYIFFALLAIFSTWLMWSTFSYHDGSMYIASKAWSDFASHIPLIRSFSLGSNFPPQYPIFPGEPIKYHFLFYFFVAMLEKIGIRLDFALNIPSFLGFFFLLVMIYVFAKKIFSSKAVGILSVIFFLFNGSLSFLEFFRQHPFGIHTLTDILSNKTFSSFGPYDGKIVSAFWNLNIYTNQRHFALSLGISLLLIFIFLRPVLDNKQVNLKISLLIGFLLGIFFFFHTAVFLMTIILIILLGIFFRKLLLSSIIITGIAAIIAAPQYIYLSHASSNFHISIVTGYLIYQDFTFINFISYWFQNLGLHSILIPVGFVLAAKKQKKLFVAFFSLFLVGNILQFTPDMPTNHKFFNYFMIIGTMFSAYTVVWLWNKWDATKPLVIAITLLLILSGIIDFFPIFNDYQIALADYPKNETIAWIKNNTPQDSIFLNSTYLYTPESLAGRKILLGWPYFSWGAGYDEDKRYNIRKVLFNASDIHTFCLIAQHFHLSYIDMTTDTKQDDPQVFVNRMFFQKYFTPLYENSAKQDIIYPITPTCT